MMIIRGDDDYAINIERGQVRIRNDDVGLPDSAGDSDGHLYFAEVLKVMAERARVANCYFCVKTITPNCIFDVAKVMEVTDDGITFDRRGPTPGASVQFSNFDRCDWVR